MHCVHNCVQLVFCETVLLFIAVLSWIMNPLFGFYHASYTEWPTSYWNGTEHCYFNNKKQVKQVAASKK